MFEVFPITLSLWGPFTKIFTNLIVSAIVVNVIGTNFAVPFDFRFYIIDLAVVAVGTIESFIPFHMYNVASTAKFHAAVYFFEEFVIHLLHVVSITMTVVIECSYSLKLSYRKQRVYV